MSKVYEDVIAVIGTDTEGGYREELDSPRDLVSAETVTALEAKLATLEAENKDFESVNVQLVNDYNSLHSKLATLEAALVARNEIAVQSTTSARDIIDELKRKIGIYEAALEAASQFARCDDVNGEAGAIARNALKEARGLKT